MRLATAISGSAGLLAALLTATVQALFGKSAGHTLLMALTMGLSAAIPAAVLAVQFERLAIARRPAACGALAFVSLVLTYLLFTILGSRGLADAVERITVSPVFVAFSLPLDRSLRLVLVFARPGRVRRLTPTMRKTS